MLFTFVVRTRQLLVSQHAVDDWEAGGVGIRILVERNCEIYVASLTEITRATLFAQFISSHVRVETFEL